jgi:hypothetical protein
VPADALGPASAWPGRVRHALRTPDGWAHEQFVAATGRAGDVAVHRARASEGLTVTSVLADPGVPAAEVLAAAYELAGPGPADRRSLFDLPLGEGPLGTVTERPARTTAADGREERCAAVLPAWSASSEHDLARADLGFPAAAAVVADALRRAGLPAGPSQARQSAVARYTRVGFEAAAVTAMAVLTGAPVPRDGLLREAVLRFGHPYAVVATATGDGAEPGAGAAWRGLPVFSAWVTRPDEADQAG